MVMRRCNDSSAVRSPEFPLSLSPLILSFSHFLTLIFSFFFPPLFLSVLVTLLDSLPSLCLRMAMIPGTAYAPFYALLFTGTWLLSTRVAILTVRHCVCVCVCIYT